MSRCNKEIEHIIALNMLRYVHFFRSSHDENKNKISFDYKNTSDPFICCKKWRSDKRQNDVIIPRDILRLY